jgi:hypothetical protein
VIRVGLTHPELEGVYIRVKHTKASFGSRVFQCFARSVLGDCKGITSRHHRHVASAYGSGMRIRQHGGVVGSWTDSRPEEKVSLITLHNAKQSEQKKHEVGGVFRIPVNPTSF